jgi:molybdopterin adenylyltransferase
MGHHEHKHHAPKQVAVALVTVSTSRGEAEDRSGPVMAELLEGAGHRVVARKLVTDGLSPIRDCLAALGDDPQVQVVLLSGGTGISTQDLSPEAIAPLIRTELPGFGELFRRLSYDEIGTAAMLSRATAAVCALGADGRRVLVVLLPGSPKAVELALARILLPELGHLVYEMMR